MLTRFSCERKRQASTSNRGRQGYYYSVMRVITAAASRLQPRWRVYADPPPIHHVESKHRGPAPRLRNEKYNGVPSSTPRFHLVFARAKVGGLVRAMDYSSSADYGSPLRTVVPRPPMVSAISHNI